uniref:NACHT domain-containing protein n=1 Tax=Amphimedon queenslandica TaxID=400682 RepID=A0A1X7TH64_AMPQE
MASIRATTILNITHLDFVLSELERLDFSEAKWEKFGLKCGLYKGRLETLEADYPKDASKCFRECISRWLRREDGVDEKGEPTLERLADIVEETGDKSTAEKIRIWNEIVTPAKDLEFHQVTQPTGMSTTPAQSSTSLWWIVLPVSILVVVLDPTPIDEYASKLRETYDRTLTRYKDPDINKYPAAGPTAPVDDVPFIPLKLIRLKSYQKKADAEFLHSVNKEILKHDNFEKIEIDSLFKPLPNKQLRFVLITGEPGIGKSTLAKELTLRWVRQTDELLNKNYKIVILILLRLKTYQKAENIEDLLINVEDTNMTEVMLSISKTRGAEVLWILDGFDELPHQPRTNSVSIFLQLIKGDILPKSTVIVTSRHAATEPLLIFLENDSKHFALRGFSPNEILKYASTYFKNGTIVSEFHSYYSGNTVIENMLYNPMNCYIMCKVFTDFIHTKNNKYPITMTGIYNQYVRALLKRHLIDAKVIDINYEMPPYLVQINNFNTSVLSDIWKHFRYLSKVAFNGVTKPKYIFGKELHDIPKLSMMDTVTSFTGFDKDESSSFIHTTLQDYFAAIYLVNNPHLMFNETDMKQNSNLENVLIFYVGLSKLIDKEIGALDMLRTNFFGEYVEDTIYIEINSLMLRCLYENNLIRHNQNYNLDSGYPWVIGNVPLNNFDYFIAGYIVAAHNITLRIKISHLTESAAFKKGLQFQKTSVNGKINIWLHKDAMAEVDLPSDAVIALSLMLELDASLSCEIISKFPLLQELYIIIFYKFDCNSTILEHPLMKLNELKFLFVSIMTYNYNSILKLLKQLVVPGRPLKDLIVLVPMKIINAYKYTEILDLTVQSSLDKLRIYILQAKGLEITFNKKSNSLLVKYFQLFVHHLDLGATHNIQLNSFTSFVYYKVKDEMIYRLEITIYSEPVTSSLNDLISAFMNYTSKMNTNTNLNAADYINYVKKLNGPMYVIVSPADPVSYEAGTTTTKYELYRNLNDFLSYLIIDTLLDNIPLPISVEVHMRLYHIVLFTIIMAFILLLFCSCYSLCFISSPCQLLILSLFSSLLSLLLL